MIKEAIEFIQNQARHVKPIDVGGIWHHYNPVTGNLGQVSPSPAAALHFSSLDGLANYVKSSKHQLGPNPIVHVESPTKVAVISDAPNCVVKRFTSAVCELHYPSFECGWYDVKTFHEHLRASFVPTMELDDLIKLCSEIRVLGDEDISDDGISQVVTVKKGVLAKNKEVPSRVTLAPYRTFREVDQPTSEFCVRLESDARKPKINLVENCEGAWEIKALELIKKYFEQFELETPVIG